MAQTMLPGQKMTLSIQPLDVNNQPVAGALPNGYGLSYSSSNAGAVSVVDNPDNLTAVATAINAGPGNGVANLTATISFTDGAGSHSYTTPIDAVTVQMPVSAIKSISLVTTTPQ